MRRALFLALAACSSAPAPKPPPFAEWSSHAEVGAALPDTTPVETPIVASAPSVASTASPSAAPTPSGPRATITLETPFKLDARPIPKERDAFLAELHERTAWNTGGLGETIADVPTPDVHPMPRVVIDVLKATGQIGHAAVERTMRKHSWIRVIECYALGAYKDQKLRGEATVRFSIAPSGKPKAGKVVAQKLPDTDVVSCLASHVTALDFGKANGMTQVTARIHIGAGDEPMPPPASVVVPGDGALSPDEMKRPIEAALPEIQRCFESAFTYAPALWGRLAIRFHVTENGKVDEAFEVESRFPDERVARCILHLARDMKFPKPRGGDVRFVVPLRLSTDQSKTMTKADAPAGQDAKATVPD